MIPCAWDVVIPSEVCSDWDNYPTATQDMALWLASTYLWAATGRQYGVCPLTIRPNQSKRTEVAYQTFEVIPGAQAGLGVAGGPFLFGGRWFNAGCSSACCGDQACAVVLRGPVASIDEVMVDGEEVPASAYRVDVTRGTYLLVRVDGECWPTCQNFSRDTTEADTFEVTYGIGRELPEALAIATALLACEYGKSLTGGVCKLPSRMTRLSRQGVEVELDTPSSSEFETGIREVDVVITSLNPGKRRAAPILVSLDLPETCDRVTVIGAGS